MRLDKIMLRKVESINRDNTWFVELDKTSELFDSIHIIIHRKNPLRLSKLFGTLKRKRKNVCIQLKY